MHALRRLQPAKPIFACAGALFLGACAGSSTNYPSFAIPTASEEAGRVAMQFPGVSVPEPRDAVAQPETLPAELDARLAAINNRAMVASKAFSANLSATRTLARSADSAPPDSDRWAEAQIRIADLTLHHNKTSLASAELDALAALAQTSQATPEETGQIAQLQSSLSGILTGQAQQLAEIAGQLDR